MSNFLEKVKPRVSGTWPRSQSSGSPVVSVVLVASVVSVSVVAVVPVAAVVPESVVDSPAVVLESVAAVVLV